MKTFSLLVFTSFVLIRATLGGDIESKAADVLDPFHRAIDKAINPWKGEANTLEMLDEAARIADEHLPQIKDDLHELAIAELNQLKIAEFDLNQYEVRVQTSTDYTVAMKEGSTTGNVIRACWNPRDAATYFRVRAFSTEGNLGRHGIGAFSVRAQHIKLEVFAISLDHDHPILAIRSAGELTIVKLEYSSDGYYRPLSVTIATLKG